MGSEEERKRRREREEEDEREQEEAQAKARKGETSKNTVSGISGPPEDKIHEFLQRADVLIDQLNNLYNMYTAGAERLPPNEKRKMLEQLMVTIQSTGKPTPAIQFKS